MPRFIKAYSDRDKTKIEVATYALSDAGARLQTGMWLFGRHPSQITAVENIEAVQMPGDEYVKSYRVIITLEAYENLREVIVDNELVNKMRSQL